MHTHTHTTLHYQVLKPGGLLLFRDYGLFDHAMLRFSRGHKIAENFYTRQDGTRAYYFSEGTKLKLWVIDTHTHTHIDRYIIALMYKYSLTHTHTYIQKSLLNSYLKQVSKSCRTLMYKKKL